MKRDVKVTKFLQDVGYIPRLPSTLVLLKLQADRPKDSPQDTSADRT